MNCPVDGTELVLSERQGIEIDYCPKCRGVWLDRGELDKIIGRESYYGESATAEEPVRYGYYDYDENDDQLDDRRLSEEQRPRRRRRSLLGELFDFG